MKRRRFIQGIVAAPAAPALIAQTASPAAPVSRGGRGGRGVQALQEVAKFETAAPDAVAQPVARFFTAAQFAALRKLSAILVPPMKGNPGALDSDAPEFVDFLIGASPADRQKLYRTGLDYLNAQAKKQYGKTFADVDATQADAILKPLLVSVAWAHDPPKDPLKNFLFAARQDIATATRNSLAATESASAAGRRGGAGGGLFWHPVDPVVRS